MMKCPHCGWTVEEVNAPARYDVDYGGFVETIDGQYVEHADYAYLASRLEQAEKKAEQYRREAAKLRPREMRCKEEHIAPPDSTQLLSRLEQAEARADRWKQIAERYNRWQPGTSNDHEHYDAMPGQTCYGCDVYDESLATNALFDAAVADEDAYFAQKAAQGEGTT